MFWALPSGGGKRTTIESMEHRVLLRPCAVLRAASFSVGALENLSLDDQPRETWDELEQETFGWTLAEGLDTEPNLRGFSTRTVWEVVEEIAEISLVEVMG
jgi:hypothetical protein